MTSAWVAVLLPVHWLLPLLVGLTWRQVRRSQPLRLLWWLPAAVMAIGTGAAWIWGAESVRNGPDAPSNALGGAEVGWNLIGIAAAGNGVYAAIMTAVIVAVYWRDIAGANQDHAEGSLDFPG